MQGDQPIEMTINEWMLSEAMDEHFSTENCGGVLISTAIIVDQFYGESPVDKYQFVCKKCYRIIEIESHEKTD